MDTTESFLRQDRFEQQVARLQALLEATRHVHSTIDASEVLRQAAGILVRELELPGAVFLRPGGHTPLMQEGEPPAPPYAGCHRFPLLSRENQLLAELVVATHECSDLTLYERDFVEGLVLQTAVALENAHLHERDLEWARVQQDLDAARALQLSLLPKSMPEIPGYSLAGRSTTCYEVGGDYLDTIPLSDGTHLLVVADVAGKGLASAIVATSFRASLRSLAGEPIPLEELAARLSQQHWAEGSEARRRYMTAFFLRLQPVTGKVQIVNAGHNAAALVLPGGTVRMIEASGTPLGMLSGMSYTTETIDFPAGSRLLLYTDGLTEVFRNEEEFGTDRLIDTFRSVPVPRADQILDVLWDTLGTFSLHAPQTDDMTALAICHLDPSAQEIHPS